MEVQVFGMRNYNEKNPVVSFRIPCEILEKLDDFVDARKESRQEYLKKLLMDDMKDRGIIKVVYE